MKKHLITILLSFIGFIASAQNVCNGVVLDKQGSPIANAKVEVVNTEISCLTDFNGAFSIEVPSTANQLKVKYIGMSTETIMVEPNVTVTMRELKKSQFMLSAQCSSDFILNCPTIGFSVGQMGNIGWYAKALWSLNQMEDNKPAFVLGGIARLNSPAHLYLGCGLSTEHLRPIIDCGFIFRLKNSFINIGTIIDTDDCHRGYTSVLILDLGIGYCF